MGLCVSSLAAIAAISIALPDLPTPVETHTSPALLLGAGKGRTGSLDASFMPPSCVSRGSCLAD